MEGVKFDGDLISDDVREVTPYSVDCIHGVWKGETVVREETKEL